MTPQERGQFIHEVFEDFFIEWQRLGHGAITDGNVREAIDLFGRIAEGRLGAARRRGSSAGAHAVAGIRRGGRACRARVRVRDRAGRPRSRTPARVPTAGHVRVFRGRRRRGRSRSVRRRIASICSQTARCGSWTTSWAGRRTAIARCSCPSTAPAPRRRSKGATAARGMLSRAGYIAFKEKQPFVSLGKTQEELDEGAARKDEDRLCAAVDGIERGEFPVQPDEPLPLHLVRLSAVCRKDYVGDE